MTDRTRPRILLVEDDERLGRQVATHLTRAGYDVRWLRDGAEALGAPTEGLALIVLDLMLPGADGLDVLKRVRSQADLPVLVLSARQDARDRVRALELGADDFVAKPFWPEELLARIAARLRRPVLRREGVLTLGALELDVTARRAAGPDGELSLTRVEFDLLAALAQRPGAAVPRAWLTEHVLDPDGDADDRTLDVHVSRLRKKLGSLGPRISTVWGIGYRFDAQDGEESA